MVDTRDGSAWAAGNHHSSVLVQLISDPVVLLLSPPWRTALAIERLACMITLQCPLTLVAVVREQSGVLVDFDPRPSRCSGRATLRQ